MADNDGTGVGGGQQQQAQQAGGDGGSGGGGQQAQQQQPAAGSGDWKAGIPAHMLKDTAEATVAEVFKGYKGFLDKQAAAGPVGKTADDYKFSFGERLQPYFSQADDPALKNYQAAMAKHNIPIKVGQAILEDVFGPLVEAGKLPKPFDPKSELAGMAQMLKVSGPEAGPAVEAAVRETQAWAQNAGKTLGLSEAAQVELQSLSLTAAGFELLRALQSKSSADGFRLGGSGPSAPLTRSELDAMQSDPRFDPASPKYDRSFRQRYEDGWKVLDLTRR